MKILIVAEAKKGNLKKASLELLELSKGQEVSALIFGSDSEPATKTLASKGVATVFWVSAKEFDTYHPEAYAAALEGVIRETQPEVVLGSSSSLGKDLLPRIAARFDAPLGADCTALTLSGGPIKVKRPFFSGKAVGELEFDKAKLTVISMRPNSGPAGEVGSSAGTIKSLSPSFDFKTSRIKCLGKTEAKSERPDLTEASIIVSGGRSLKARENFKIIFELADVIGAAVGASRAAVDEGLADHDMQVGQTGKTVNPNLYVACGISGAIQHLAGMRTSKVIVAVNKDPQAPIFTKADYGVVGDLFTLVPLMTAECKKLLQK